MIDTVEKMKEDGNTRGRVPDGYYLVQHFEGARVDIVYIKNYSNRVAVFIVGNEWESGLDDFHWIADEPLDLDDVMKVHLSGGSDKMVQSMISTYLDCFS